MLTSTSGFRAAVVEAPQPALTLFRGITDQFVEGNRTTSFNLPADAFAHTRPEAVLSVEAKLTDGQSLPSWVQFDARAGSFIVTPPQGFNGALEIRVTARDSEGREAAAVFKFNVGEGLQTPGNQSAVPPPADVPRPQGRNGLTEQLLRVAQARSGLAAAHWRTVWSAGDLLHPDIDLESMPEQPAPGSVAPTDSLLDRLSSAIRQSAKADPVDADLLDLRSTERRQDSDHSGSGTPVRVTVGASSGTGA
jgi:hypothetical protein